MSTPPASRWPAVHVPDAAPPVRLALEQAPAGSVLHAVADEGVPVRGFAAVIGRHLNVPPASVPAEDLGFLGMVLGLDCPASSTFTRELLGWQPVQPGLIEDLDKGHYFAYLAASVVLAVPELLGCHDRSRTRRRAASRYE